MSVVLVTGANGQVGKSIQELAVAFPEFKFAFTTKQELDITDNESVHTAFRKYKPAYCVNCAAYTAVDKAESEESAAHRVNVLGVRNLAQACLFINIPFIHLSTDYVYNSPTDHPYKEDADTQPQGVYANTKLEGETIAMKIHPFTLIIRTSWVYSVYGKNFVKTMINLGNSREEINVVNDQTGTPTYAPDIASTILSILQQVEKGHMSKSLLRGIFNYSNEGETTWYEFAKTIFEYARVSCQVNPIDTKSYPTPAKRPPYSVLDTNKIKSTFHLSIPHWKDSLRQCIDQLYKIKEYEI